MTTHPTRATRPEDRIRPLTGREREILALLAEGLTEPQVARRLTISPGTVKTHKGNLFAALGARSTAHAVALGYQQGLLT